MVDVKWIKEAKDGSTTQQVGSVASVPNVGDGIVLGGKGYRVSQKASAPRARTKHTIYAKEV